MRELTEHKVEGVEDGLTVQAHGVSGTEAGEVSDYSISFATKEGVGEHFLFKFQRGTVPIMGNNGITTEAVLAILIDRLECLQRGGVTCRENEVALSGLRLALAALKCRTTDRVFRGVEGTYKP